MRLECSAVWERVYIFRRFSYVKAGHVVCVRLLETRMNLGQFENQYSPGVPEPRKDGQTSVFWDFSGKQSKHVWSDRLEIDEVTDRRAWKRILRAKIEADSHNISSSPLNHIKTPAKIFAQHRMFRRFFRWFFECDAWYFNFFLQLKWKKNQ